MIRKVAGKLLCFFRWHNTPKYEIKHHPFRAEGTCTRCGNKDVWL